MQLLVVVAVIICSTNMEISSWKIVILIGRTITRIGRFVIYGCCLNMFRQKGCRLNFWINGEIRRSTVTSHLHQTGIRLNICLQQLWQGSHWFGWKLLIYLKKLSPSKKWWRSIRRYNMIFTRELFFPLVMSLPDVPGLDFSLYVTNRLMTCSVVMGQEVIFWFTGKITYTIRNG